MTATYFVPVCAGCGGGACYGIGSERRDFSKLAWWCGRCIPAELATWRKTAAPFETPPAAAPQGEVRKQFAGGLF